MIKKVNKISKLLIAIFLVGTILGNVIVLKNEVYGMEADGGGASSSEVLAGLGWSWKNDKVKVEAVRKEKELNEDIQIAVYYKSNEMNNLFYDTSATMKEPLIVINPGDVKEATRSKFGDDDYLKLVVKYGEYEVTDTIRYGESKTVLIKEEDTKTPDGIFQLPEKNDRTDGTSSIDEVIDDADGFLSQADELKYDDSKLQSFSQTISNILLTVGVVISVLVGAILGIKIMTSSVEEKAKYKELLVPYVIGCIAVFGAFFIWRVLVEMLQKI